MARLILDTKTQTRVTLSASGHTATGKALSASQCEARLRQKRSAAYISAMVKLDVNGHCPDVHALSGLLAAIREELPEIELSQLPVGIVARCFLGAPYEVHSLDRNGEIVRHYKENEAMPGQLERARSLAAHPAYAFIEVYSDKIITVDANGVTSVVNHKD